MSDADIVSLPNPATLFTHDRATNTAKCGKCRETKSGKWCRRFMTQHVMTHTGERPWGCPYCDFRSVRRHTMFRHLTQEHRSRGVRMTFKRRTITAVSVHASSLHLHHPLLTVVSVSVAQPFRRYCAQGRQGALSQVAPSQRSALQASSQAARVHQHRVRVPALQALQRVTRRHPQPRHARTSARVRPHVIAARIREA